ncbi:hypothetical protein AB0O95_00290 [Rhodoglobus sp. NPDC076762]
MSDVLLHPSDPRACARCFQIRNRPWPTGSKFLFDCYRQLDPLLELPLQFIDATHLAVPLTDYRDQVLR